MSFRRLLLFLRAEAYEEGRFDPVGIDNHILVIASRVPFLIRAGLQTNEQNVQHVPPKPSGRLGQEVAHHMSVKGVSTCEALLKVMSPRTPFCPSVYSPC